MTSPAVVKHEFSSPFLLDKSKISRMIDIIANKFKAHGFQPSLSFDVTLQNGKKVSLTLLDELLSLDNAVHNSISVLIIRVNDLNNDPNKNFRVSIHYDNDKRDNVVAQVESTESGVALQLFAELEEQIERTLLKNWAYSMMKRDFFTTFAAIFMIPVMLLAIGSSIWQLSSSNIEKRATEMLIGKYSEATTQEEKINFLFDYTMEQIKSEQSKSTPNEFDLDRFLTLQTLFIVLPILIVVGTLIYIFTKCYPYANFLWGDYEEHYTQIISRRSTLWNLVIGSILLGIIGNLFVMGISGYFRLGQ
jgi:hypothetical protein